MIVTGRVPLLPGGTRLYGRTDTVMRTGNTSGHRVTVCWIHADRHDLVRPHRTFRVLRARLRFGMDQIVDYT